MCLLAMCVPALTWVYRLAQNGGLIRHRQKNVALLYRFSPAQDRRVTVFCYSGVRILSEALNISCLPGGATEVTARGELEQCRFGLFGYV